MDYYRGYLLDDMYCWQLTEVQQEALDLCIWLVDYKCSIRELAKEFMISKSTVYRRIDSTKKYCNELYKLCRKQLNKNKEKFFH